MFELVEKRQHHTGRPQKTLVSVLVSGVPDSSGEEISDAGKNQVFELSRSRIVSAVGRIVCGPEQVVTESAQIASREFGVRYEVDRSLADVRIGRERDTKKHANLLMRWWSDPDFVAPRGESLNEVRRRISTTMNSLASRNAGDSLAIIVSPAIEIVVRFLVFGGNPTIHDWLGCGYASCTAYEYLEGGWSLVMPSDNSYLSEPITVGDSLPVELRRELERV